MKTARWFNTASKYIGGFIALLGFVFAVIALFQGQSANTAFITYLMGITTLISAEVNEVQWEHRTEHRDRVTAAELLAQWTEEHGGSR